MNRLKFGLSATAIAGACAAGLSLAQPAPSGMGPMGREVSREQARAGAEQLFAAMDLNRDGKIDAADREARMSQMFDRIDTDHDGKITRSEFLAAHRDGMGAGMGHHEPGEPGGPAGMMRMRAMAMGGQILREADPQHTGAVSHDAFITAALTLFDKADANHDGKVTPEERRAAMMNATHARGRMGGHEMGGHEMGGRDTGGMDMHGGDMMPGPGE